MGIIKPTLTITSNAATATTDAGPMSIALSLSTTDSLTIAGHVESKIHNFADATSHTILFDGANALYGGDTETAGTVGAYIYFKNIGTTGDVYIGVGADNDVAQDLGAANQEDAFGADTANAIRLFTLRPGEFAWMPYDYAVRIFGDASAAASLEYWLFDKA
tara:strand:- start:219 stop:704 length:486 start_codon:yes stop_codon:yes gene_type:complete